LYRKIGIVRLTAMGDIVHTMASLQFIKQFYPDMEISWFVEEKFAQILQNSPDIDNIIPLNLHSLKDGISIQKVSKIIKSIKEHSDLDMVIDVQGLIKSAIVSRVASSNVSGLDRKSAREGVASILYKQKFSIDCAEIAPYRFASLISKSLNIEITKSMLLAKEPYLYYDRDKISSDIDSYFSKDKKNIIIIVGASNESKIYPKEKFVTLCKELRDYNILLVAGSPKEREDAKFIESNSHSILLPKGDLNTLKYIISISDLLIGADTGPSHIAWALNKPSILLFGSTPTAMMMQTDINIAISASTPPNPCRFDKNDRSIESIEPSLIAQKVKGLLNG